MTDKKISALTVATSTDGTEPFPIVQAGSTKQLVISKIKDYILSLTNVFTADQKVQSANRTVGDDANLRVGVTDAMAANKGGMIGFYATYSGSTDTIYAGVAGRKANATDANLDGYLSIIVSKAGLGCREAGRFDADRNYVPVVAGTGINFTANTPAAGMTSQLLNWYEEGTWTPAVSAGAGTITTLGTVVGRYTRIGRQVTLSWAVTITTNGTGSGYLIISGVPFTPSSAVASYSGSGVSNNTGKSLSVLLDTAGSFYQYVRLYDATYPAGDGVTLFGQVTFNV